MANRQSRILTKPSEYYTMYLNPREGIRFEATERRL